MERSGRIGSLLNSLPGYAGYRDKENRRDADRAVRDRVAAALQQRSQRIDVVAASIAGAGDLAAVGPVTQLGRDLRALETRVLTAGSGYGGLFGARDIDAAALDQIGAFDEALLEGVAALDAPLTGLEAATPETRGAAIAAVRAVLTHLGAQFAARGQVIETARPSTVVPALPPVAAAIDGATAPGVSPAWDLHDRDAIAILGDNAIIDARIEVDAADASFRLFRLQGDAPRAWLLAPKRPGGTHALLREATPPADAQASTFDGAAYAVTASGRGAGSAVGAGGSASPRALAWRLYAGTADGARIAVALEWPTERQLFTGTSVDPRDIERFGSSIR